MMDRRNFFHVHAEKWDDMFAPAFVKRVEAEIVPRLGLSRGQKVLDVGSGTGLLLPMIKKCVGIKGSVTALDYAPGMIAQAQKKFGSWYSYVCAPAEKTGLRSASFDVVVCFNAFPHFPDKVKVLKEFYRLLQRNGRLVIAHADNRAAINAFHANIGGVVGSDMLPENDEMIAAMRKAGFIKPEITEGEKLYLSVAIKK